MGNSLLHAALFEDSDDSHTVRSTSSSKPCIAGLETQVCGAAALACKNSLHDMKIRRIKLKNEKTVGAIVQVVKLAKWDEHGRLQAGTHTPRQVKLHV
jgi:hypothetical protein